ncbi:amino acid/polyamine transporter I [Phlyctochytrium arcticum]|nr:amino acid/polyamine transporter I [Phlyctochytrium arcticum]
MVETAAKSTPHMGLFTSICMVIGVVIGVGIFGTPQAAYNDLGSLGLTLICWVVCGLITIAGAFCYAELGCAMPEDGGEHNYLLRAFGPYVAYSFDWTQSLLSWPLSCSAVATIVSQYIAKLILLKPHLTPDEQPAPPEWATKLISIILIITFLAVNCISATLGTRVQRYLTIIKFLAVSFVAVIGFVYIGKGETGNFNNAFEGTTTDVGKIGSGLTFLLFCFGGFNNLNLMLGEMKNVEKKLPIALILSLSLVTAIYLISNIAYFAALPLSTIANTKVIGLSIGHRALGNPGSIIISLLIILSAMGSINALLYGNARLIAAFAKDGIIFPKRMAATHSSRRTPVNALCLTAAFCILLSSLGNTDALVKMYAFSTYFYFAITVAGLLWLRRTEPDMHRPFKVWWPVAVLFIVASIFVVVFQVVMVRTFADLLPYILAVVFMAIPVPVVAFNLSRQRKQQAKLGLGNDLASTDLKEMDLDHKVVGTI